MEEATNDQWAVYPGKDLEAMSFAVRYYRWLFNELRPYIGRRVVEVGAGTGSFSEMILDTEPEILSLIEPSKMFLELVKNVTGEGSRTDLRHHRAIFEFVADEIKADASPDTIVYVNVLEHIDDDERELELIYNTLEPGGRLLIFVPAVQALFSDFDRSIGHYRRYSKRDLERKVTDAGFRIVKSKNFDAAGVLPWFVKYRLLRSMNMDQRSVSIYDGLVVPIVSRLESILPVPIGKNIVLVAEK